MKRFCNKAILIFFISFVSISIVNVIMLHSADNWSLHSHERNIKLAHNRLKALKDSNKIVIIAGSNGGFSINSRLLSNAFNIPVVNTSTHAGIGTRMQFEMYKDFLKKADIVIFCPEYDSGLPRLYGGSVLLRILSTHMPNAYCKISLSQWIHLYKYIGIHYNEVCEHRDINEFEGVYSEKSLNEYGDIECERPHQDSIKLYDLKGEMDKDLIKYYKYIQSYTQEKGIKLILLPPTFIESNFKRNKRQIDSIAFTLKKNGIGYQASPIRYSFPDSLYYDTPYHMTQSGADKRTEIIIEDLHRLLP